MLLTLFLLTQNARAEQTSLVAIADSYVDNNNPTTNYGGVSSLYVYNQTFQYFPSSLECAWLKFNLSSVPSGANITSIVLRVRTTLWGPFATNEVGVFYCNDNSWTEAGITWNNTSSAVETTPLRTVNITSTNTNYDFELTSFLKGKSVVSLILESMHSTAYTGAAPIYSRESGYGPKLIVDYTMPSTGNPIDPTIPILAAVIIVVVLAIAVIVLRRKKGTGKQPTTAPQSTTAPQ